MRVFKTPDFSKYARREGVGHEQLCDAVRRAETGLVDANLGDGLIKQRVARAGQGRRSGFRLLLAFQTSSHAVFVSGFAKNERENIPPDELLFWRSVANGYMKLNEEELEFLLNEGDLEEVRCVEHDK